MKVLSRNLTDISKMNSVFENSVNFRRARLGRTYDITFFVCLVSFSLAFFLELTIDFNDLKRKKIAENAVKSTFSAIVETVGLEPMTSTLPV